MAEIRTRTLVIILAAVFGPLLIWILLDILIVTDSHRIEAMCEQMVLATEAEDPRGMVRFIAENYSYEGLTRDDLRALAERYFTLYGDTTATITTSTVNVQGALASADVVVAVRSANGEFSGYPVPTRWRLVFARRSENVSTPKGRRVAWVWRIIEIQPVAVGRVNVDGWRSIVERLGSPARPGPRKQ